MGNQKRIIQPDPHSKHNITALDVNNLNYLFSQTLKNTSPYLVEKFLQFRKEFLKLNLIFKNENLNVLRVLEKTHSNSIKCIYIDPPYNTGFDREHYQDNFNSLSWAEMMQERLIVLQSLLTEDGSIWISIDDSEVHNLKKILEKVFGKENYLATITWQHKINWAEYKGKLQLDHTYIVSFQKSDKFKFSNNQKPKTVWLESETGGQAEAIQESQKIFGPNNVFCTPKPEKLIKTIIQLTTNPDDIVLDCFAGSGTTGAAAQKLKRHWILIEMGEQCNTHVLKRMEMLAQSHLEETEFSSFYYIPNLEDYTELVRSFWQCNR